MSFFTKKSPISTEIVFDIESDSVSASIIVYETGKTPRVVYHAESEIEHKIHVDGVYRGPHLTRAMLKMLEQAASKAQASMVGLMEKKLIDQMRFDRIHVVLSSPWIISKLSCVEKKFEQETVMRQSTVTNLLLDEKTASAKIFSAGDSVVIDAKIFEIKINGYPVVDYEGKRARSLQGTMVFSFASRKLLNDIKSCINRSIRAGDEIFHSAVILRYLALRSAMPQHVDYVWLQIHGELTDILVVRQGVCVTSGSLPFGTATLVRDFAREAGEAAAVSTLTLLDSNANDSHAEDMARSFLEQIMPEWTHGIINIISEGGELALPSVIYISAGHLCSAFVEALKKSASAVSVMRADAGIMALYVEPIPAVSVDLSTSLYVAALPLARRL